MSEAADTVARHAPDRRPLRGPLLRSPRTTDIAAKEHVMTFTERTLVLRLALLALALAAAAVAVPASAASERAGDGVRLQRALDQPSGSGAVPGVWSSSPMPRRRAAA